MEITPLFQLNFILHMCMPYNKQSGIYPFFRELGLSLQYIEHSIPLPEDSINCLKSMGVNKQKVKPELLLTNSNHIVLLECKVADFQYDLSHHATQQALGYFSLNNNHLKNYYAFNFEDNVNSHILYGVSCGDVNKVVSALEHSKNEIIKILGSALPHEIFQIICKQDGVYVGIKDFKNPDNSNEILVIDFSLLESPELLYLIPVDIEGRMDKNGDELIKIQVRNALRSIIGRNIGNKEYTISLEDLIVKINPYFDVLPSKFKKNFKFWLYNSIKECLKELHLNKLNFNCTSKSLHIPKLKNEKERIQILKKLTSTKFMNDNTFQDFHSIQTEFNFEELV